MRNRENAGLSMVEILLVIGIMLSLGAGILYQSSQAAERLRRIEAQTQITDIRRRVNVVWSGRAWPDMAMEDEFTRDLARRGVDLLDPWKKDVKELHVKDDKPIMGNILVIPHNGYRTNPRIDRPSFAIRLGNLPRSTCIWLGSAFMQDSTCIIPNDRTQVSDTSCAKDISALNSGCDQTENSLQLWFRKE